MIHYPLRSDHQDQIDAYMSYFEQVRFETVADVQQAIFRARALGFYTHHIELLHSDQYTTMEEYEDLASLIRRLERMAANFPDIDTAIDIILSIQTTTDQIDEVLGYMADALLSLDDLFLAPEWLIEECGLTLLARSEFTSADLLERANNVQSFEDFCRLTSGSKVVR